MITSQMVKELREKSAAGMMDCKKALDACDGDIEKAIVWLREKGITKAEKKSGRVAAEGLCSFAQNANSIVTFELNSETDFVAKNDKFNELVALIGQLMVDSNVTNTEEALALVSNGKTIETIILENAGVIGEKLSLRRVSRISKTDSQVFGAYKHMGGRIVSVALLNGSDEVVAKDIAMHVAASAPKFISKENIPAEEIQKEKDIITATALNENAEAAKPKPENIIVEKIVPGRLEKGLKEICLLSQQFVKNPDQTVEAYVNGAKMSVVNFVRLEVGEGIEKEVTDFAAEVAAQAGLNK